MSNINIEEFNRDYNSKREQMMLNELPQRARDLAKAAYECEKNEEYDKAEQICRKILEDAQEGANYEQIRLLQARIYPKLLRTDIESGSQNYHKDLQRYYDFLEGVNMNELMQQYLVETLVGLCGLMENRWYRPLFYEFVSYIESKGYITDDRYQRTLESAYASAESYEYYEDAEVSFLMKLALKAFYQREFTCNDEQLEAYRNEMMVDALTNEWYVLKYYENNASEFEYIKDKFPHSYKMMVRLIDDIKYDSKAASDKILDKLMSYVSDGVDKEQLETAMETSYENIINSKKKTSVVYEGEGSYKRKNIKVGRNDLCPCGSGKKYKQCCGKYE